MVLSLPDQPWRRSQAAAGQCVPRRHRRHSGGQSRRTHSDIRATDSRRSPRQRGLSKTSKAPLGYRESQFEVSDMLTGHREPELGGHETCVDVVGLNFYHDNQWEYPSGRKLAWHVAGSDARWRPLHRLLKELFERYRRPLYVAETSHVGEGRAAWLREVSDEVHVAAESWRTDPRRVPVSDCRPLWVGRRDATGTTAVCGTCSDRHRRETAPSLESQVHRGVDGIRAGTRSADDVMQEAERVPHRLFRRGAHQCPTRPDQLVVRAGHDADTAASDLSQRAHTGRRARNGCCRRGADPSWHWQDQTHTTHS